MKNENLISLKDLSEQELLNRTLGFVAEEKQAQLALIECLREVSRRNMHLQMGYSSLWEFATKFLKLSEGAAQRRLSAMRLTTEVPEAKAALESGQINLSVASRLQSFLQNEKKQGIHRTAVQKGEFISEFLKPASGEGAAQNRASDESSHAAEGDQKISAGISQSECDRKLAELAPHVPLTSEKARPIGNRKTELKIILDEPTMKRLEELKDLLAHRLPQVTYSDVVATVIEDALKQTTRKVAGKPSAEYSNSERPDSEPNTTQSECTIAAAVKPETTGLDPRDIGIPSSMIRKPIPTQVRQFVWLPVGPITR